MTMELIKQLNKTEEKHTATRVIEEDQTVSENSTQHTFQLPKYIESFESRQPSDFEETNFTFSQYTTKIQIQSQKNKFQSQTKANLIKALIKSKILGKRGQLFEFAQKSFRSEMGRRQRKQMLKIRTFDEMIKPLNELNQNHNQQSEHIENNVKLLQLGISQLNSLKQLPQNQMQQQFEKLVKPDHLESKISNHGDHPKDDQPVLSNSSFTCGTSSPKFETDQEKLHQNIEHLKLRLQKIENFQRLEQELISSGDLDESQMKLSENLTQKIKNDILRLQQESFDKIDSSKQVIETSSTVQAEPLGKQSDKTIDFDDKVGESTQIKSNESDVQIASNDPNSQPQIIQSDFSTISKQEIVSQKKYVTVEDILDEALADYKAEEADPSVQHFNKYQKRLQTILYQQLAIFRDIIKKNKKVTNLLRMDPQFENDQFSEQQIGIRNQVFEMIDLNQKMDQVVIIHCNKVIPSRQPAKTNYRGSNLRGISRNGRNNWQILFMNDGSKSYLGTVDNILKAAILYDILAIQAKGLKAKTNFNFNKREIYSFLQIPSLVKIKKDLLAQKREQK